MFWDKEKQLITDKLVRSLLFLFNLHQSDSQNLSFCISVYSMTVTKQKPRNNTE